MELFIVFIVIGKEQNLEIKNQKKTRGYGAKITHLYEQDILA
jgi:uncharacterized protein YebE (UPF0316 family)